MDVYEFFREYARMFMTLRKGAIITDMYITVKGFLYPGRGVSFECSAIKDEIDKVIDWSKNHPRKTRLQDFKEKYPNAELPYGKPPVCAKNLGYDAICLVSTETATAVSLDMCKKCWNEPVD